MPLNSVAVNVPKATPTNGFHRMRRQETAMFISASPSAPQRVCFK